MNVLVTGANGFIGARLCSMLRDDGCRVRAAVRSAGQKIDGARDIIPVGDLGPGTVWRRALTDIDAVVHCAGRAHVPCRAQVAREKRGYGRGEFLLVNGDATRTLALQSAKAGVKRFIYISTVKVHGEFTPEGRTGGYAGFNEAMAPAPADAYAVSKWEGEQAVRMAAADGMQSVILRFPLVYGPGVKANFRQLITLACCGIPLPFASVHNCRSLLYLDNACDSIVRCLKHPRAAGQVFLVSDGADLSTPELIRLIAESAGRPARLFVFPPGLLNVLARLIGGSAAVQRLTGSLRIDSRKISQVLDWHPPVTVEEGILRTVKYV
jgi:nucleoside-diphosphate-sugar epimerase